MTPIGKRKSGELDRLYVSVKKTFIARQHPITGLLPASTASNAHGDYTDAWVRDNVYSIYAVWGLSRAFKRSGHNAGRTFLLEQSCVRLMRGLLSAMMRQSDKVERFKLTEDPADALHAKYETATGDTVVADDAWGHLQIDATSLFLLTLAQMVRAGLPIVQSTHEADFIQNLIWYVGRAYRVADYGIWERGHKQNHGAVEINASSVGVAKAALEAMRGLNVFGKGGSFRGRIFVVLDEIARARETLVNLLPAESGSKETDAALLAVVGWPAFAIEDESLIKRTMDRIHDRLEGNYGCKRFLRDGHQTVTEQHDRLHYEAGELTKFAGLESEWPLFFTYMALAGYMRGDERTGKKYLEKLEPLFVERDGEMLLPELYFVPKERLEAERENPGSAPRTPNENVPLYWAQSLHLLASLLAKGHILPEDIDPIGRRRVPGKKVGSSIRIGLIAHDEESQKILKDAGLTSELMDNDRKTMIAPLRDLTGIMSELGSNADLGLSGRPVRRLGSLLSSRVFELGDGPIVFIPSFLDDELSYFMYDSAALAARLKAELSHISRHWIENTDPLMLLCFDHHELKGQGAGKLIDLLKALQDGDVGGIKAEYGLLDEHVGMIRPMVLKGPFPITGVSGTSQRTAIEDISNEVAEVMELKALETWGEGRNTAWLIDYMNNSSNLSETAASLAAMLRRIPRNAKSWVGTVDLPCEQEISTRLQDCLHLAAQAGQWRLVRFTAEALGYSDERLPDALKEILVRSRRLLVGDRIDNKTVINEPIEVGRLKEIMRGNVRGISVWPMLKEELLLHAGAAIKTDDSNFHGVHSINLHDLADYLVRQNENGLSGVLDQSPSAIADQIRDLYSGQEHLIAYLQNPEAEKGFELTRHADGISDWRLWRLRLGTVLKVSDRFYPKIFQILKQSESLAIGDPYRIENRLDSATLTSDTTQSEVSFAWAVDSMLGRLKSPYYRCLYLEALNAISAEFEESPDLYWHGCLSIDDLLIAVNHRCWSNRDVSDDDSDQDVSDKVKWDYVSTLSPVTVAETIVEELRARMQ